MSRSLAGEVNLRQIAYSFGPYRGGLDFNHDDKHVQCNLLLDNSSSSGETTADYEGRTLNWRILNRLKQFCQQTSGHGIPWLGSSPNIFYRLVVWLKVLKQFCFQFNLAGARRFLLGAVQCSGNQSFAEVQ